LLRLLRLKHCHHHTYSFLGYRSLLLRLLRLLYLMQRLRLLQKSCLFHTSCSHYRHQMLLRLRLRRHRVH
jgi:hypothetical protein